MKDVMAEGDFITINGVEGPWRVGSLIGNRLYLTPCDKDGKVNAFNAASGLYWITLGDEGGGIKSHGMFAPDRQRGELKPDS